MSNNIYDILKKMQKLESPKQSLTEGKNTKPDYLDMNKDGDKTESMKKAVKDKNKSAVAEAVAQVEQQLNEKYMGFKKTVAAVKKGGSAEDPEAVAASIGRKKYGKEKFQKAAAAGKKLGEDFGPEDYRMPKDLALAQMRAKEKPQDDSIITKGLKKASDAMTSAASSVGTALEPVRKGIVGAAEKIVSLTPGGKAEVEKEQAWRAEQEKKKLGADIKSTGVDESALQAYLGKKKYGKQGMTALQKAGREGASKEKMEKIRARYDKMDESDYNEDVLTSKQKKFAALAEPKDKITYADKIAGAKKSKKTEGNKFTGNLMKARAQGLKQADLDGDGDMEPVRSGKTMREGWEEMQKYLEKKRGPESKGGEGKKAGTRYGGSAQRDDNEEINGEGEPQQKRRGRPKGTGSGAKFNFKKIKD